MRELTKEELKKVNGGGLSWAALTAATFGIVFVIGFLDGLVRPLKCN